MAAANRIAINRAAFVQRRKDEIMPVLRATYGAEEAEVWFHRWRVFFLACAELFAYRDGAEWLVSHQRLRPKAGPSKDGSAS